MISQSIHKPVRRRVCDAYFRSVGRSYGAELTVLFGILILLAIIGLSSGY